LLYDTIIGIIIYNHELGPLVAHTTCWVQPIQ